VTADIFAQRPGATADDYFHVTLHYGRKRAVLHASTVAPKPGPHFTVHGDGGSLFTYGMDWQEETLKSGKLPGGPGWGPIGAAPHGEVFNLDGVRTELRIPDGSYQSFYAGVAEALQSGSAPPVNPEDARKSLMIMEAAFKSAAAERTVRV
jgi:scyllo-inositol 2-dehydrogenase (NADP+)